MTAFISDHEAIQDINADDPATEITLPEAAHQGEVVWLDITGQNGAALPGDIEIVLDPDGEEGTRVTTDATDLGPYRLRGGTRIFAFASAPVAIRVTVKRSG